MRAEVVAVSAFAGFVAGNFLGEIVASAVDASHSTRDLYALAGAFGLTAIFSFIAASVESNRAA